MFTETDLDNMLTTLGTACTVAGVEQLGIYRRPYKVVDSYSGGIASTAPTLQVKSSLAAEITYETPVTVYGVDYRVNEIQEEQTGFTRLTLSKDS